MIEQPNAFGDLVGQGTIKAVPEDFQVTEVLSFTPDAGGEHLWLQIEKRDWNTEDVAIWLAKSASLSRRAVGYSGLKDRHAVTRQWFSLHLPGKPDPQLDMPEGLRLLTASRHSRKLNRGTHRFNDFSLRVTSLNADADALENRLQEIRQRGVPNYFGLQRMGRDQNNLHQAQAWLSGDGEAPRKKRLRGFWLSAMRSHLFNQVLAERVRRQCWDTVLEGDILQPVSSRGLFMANDDNTAVERMAKGEVHPTAPLPGTDAMMPTGQALALEQQALLPFQAEINGLQQEKLKAARRATRLYASQMAWQHHQHTLELAFRLPTGSFATTLLAAIIGEGDTRP